MMTWETIWFTWFIRLTISTHHSRRKEITVWSYTKKSSNSLLKQKSSSWASKPSLASARRAICLVNSKEAPSRRGADNSYSNRSSFCLQFLSPDGAFNENPKVDPKTVFWHISYAFFCLNPGRCRQQTIAYRTTFDPRGWTPYCQVRRKGTRLSKTTGTKRSTYSPLKMKSCSSQSEKFIRS